MAGTPGLVVSRDIEQGRVARIMYLTFHTRPTARAHKNAAVPRPSLMSYNKQQYVAFTVTPAKKAFMTAPSVSLQLTLNPLTHTTAASTPQTPLHHTRAKPRAGPHQELRVINQWQQSTWSAIIGNLCT